jgi:hypothetical protein
MTTEKEEREYYAGLIDLAALSADCKKFMSSKLGEYINTRAQKHELVILRRLAKVDVKDTAKIRALQLEAAGPRLMLLFISNAITEGENAEYQLSQEYTQE